MSSPPDRPEPSDPIQIELRGASKRYGEVVGVAAVDLAVARGEFFSLLGPSGCGKSTILKLIAGFEEPTAGAVLIAGRSMRGVNPEQRNTGYVFQNYALFPHMTVAENIAFGLRARGDDAPTARQRVQTMLELVELPGLGDRKPGQLSGGQQQRVALARALVIEPDVLLLDEPLGALDRKLRQAMQIKLVELQRQLGVTTIFVTHDQEEALTMSDRIGVMSVQRHRIEQVGAPREIYERPASVLVSSFIGQTNLWEETIESVDEPGRARTANGFIVAPTETVTPGQRFVVSLRPERILMLPSEAAPEPGLNAIKGEVRDTIFVGETTTYHVRTDLHDRLQATQLNAEATTYHERRATVWLAWTPMSMQLLPPTAILPEKDP